MKKENYLPFDLETALKHPEKVVTRDGEKVTQLTKFEARTDYPLRGVIGDKLNDWSIEGVYYLNLGKNKNDLFLLPEVKTCYLNIYQLKSNGDFSVTLHDSHEEAVVNWQKTTEEGQKIYTYIKTIRITNEPE
jgi:hypothetical protein